MNKEHIVVKANGTAADQVNAGNVMTVHQGPILLNGVYSICSDGINALGHIWVSVLHMTFPPVCILSNWQLVKPKAGPERLLLSFNLLCSFHAVSIKPLNLCSHRAK